MNKILDEAFTRNVEVLKSAQWSRDGSVLSHKISHFIQKYERAEKAHRVILHRILYSILYTGLLKVCQRFFISHASRNFGTETENCYFNS